MTPKAKAAVEETRRLLSDSESQVAAMSQAGYSDVYIANQVKQPLVEIRRVLSDLRAPTSR